MQNLEDILNLLETAHAEAGSSTGYGRDIALIAIGQALVAIAERIPKKATKYHTGDTVKVIESGRTGKIVTVDSADINLPYCVQFMTEPTTPRWYAEIELMQD